MNTTKIGNRAEKSAAKHLKGRGFRVIEFNWKVPSAEIDIIAQKGDSMYFAEVKYRSTNKQGDGLDYIHPRKLHQMSRAAELWVQINGWDGPYELLGISIGVDFKVQDVIEINL